MKRLLLFARDPGGANVIQALATGLLKSYEGLLYAKDVALERFQKAGLQVKNIEQEVEAISIEQMEIFLKSKQIDLVVTGTSADDRTEKYLWKASEHLNIPSIAILDQWINYGIRFSKYGVNQMEDYEKNRRQEYLPTCICVMDAYAKEKMEEEGVPSDKIKVTGHPYLTEFVQAVGKVNEADRQEFREKFGKNTEKILLFASEPICKTYGSSSSYWGYDEETIFECFKEQLEQVAAQIPFAVSVVVRPHPKEDLDKWQKRLKDSSYVSYFLDRQTDYKVAMCSVDGVVGMSSMFLLESTLCGKPVISIQKGLKPERENPFILEKIGVLKSARTSEQIRTEIRELLQNEKKAAAWNIPMNATENIQKVMEALL